MSDVIAIASNIRVSPRKMNTVAGLVRGRSVADALVILEHTPRRAAKPLAKLIKSAESNATVNNKLDKKTLQITTLEIANGVSMKRFRPAARGSALPYKHRSSNIRVVVTGDEKKKPAAKAGTGQTKAKKTTAKSKKEEK